MLLTIFVVQYCLLNNSTGGINATAGNISSVPGLLQYENNSPCLYGGTNLLGFGMLALILVVAFGAMAMRFDVMVAAATAGWIGTGATLLLSQMSLLNPNVIGISLALTLIASIIALLKNGLNAY